MHRRWIAVAVLASLVAASCGAGATRDDAAEGGGATTPTGSTPAGTGVKFGDLASPCGKAKDGVTPTVKAGESGKGTDQLYIGIPNERTSQIRAGLLAEMWDSSNAFVKWCNDQGGIDGLKIAPVDIDGQVLQVEAAMTTACTSVFALVGGGFAQDNQIFTGKPGSDFHQCKLVSVAGFAVSTEVSEGSGIVQPLPNPSHVRAANYFFELAKLYPDKVGRTVAAYGDFPALRLNKEQNKLTAQQVPGFGFIDDISYAPSGQDFKVTAQQIIDSGATAVNFVGEPENFAQLQNFLDEGGYSGLIFADANHYDPLLFSQGPAAVEGTIIRLAIHPFEEADKWPATQQWLDIMKKDGVPDAKIAALGVQSFSAWLLFATAAKNCIEGAGAGVLSRGCMLDEAFKINDWTGGGLHATAHPGTNTPPECSLIIKAVDGKFVRAYPEVGSPEDKGGFSCAEDSLVKISGDSLGAGKIDPSYPSFKP